MFITGCSASPDIKPTYQYCGVIYDLSLIHIFSNANVDRAANFMQTLKNEGLASFQEGVMDVDITPIKEGTAAFQGMGEWIISNYAKLMQKDDTLRCV